MFPSFKVTYEPRSFSYHCPMILDFHKACLEDNSSRCRPFKFEEAWTKEADCKKLVEATWVKEGDAIENIRKIKDFSYYQISLILKKSLVKVKEIEGQLEKLQQECPITRKIRLTEQTSY